MSLSILLVVPYAEAEYGLAVAYEADITHNLVPAARAAGIYDVLWGDSGQRAAEIQAPLERGLAAIRADSAKFARFNAPNGWGTVEQLEAFLENLIAACRQYPEAAIKRCR